VRCITPDYYIQHAIALHRRFEGDVAKGIPYITVRRITDNLLNEKPEQISTQEFLMFFDALAEFVAS